MWKCAGVSHASGLDDDTDAVGRRNPDGKFWAGAFGDDVTGREVRTEPDRHSSMDAPTRKNQRDHTLNRPLRGENTDLVVLRAHRSLSVHRLQHPILMNIRAQSSQRATTGTPTELPERDSGTRGLGQCLVPSTVHSSL